MNSRFMIFSLPVAGGALLGLMTTFLLQGLATRWALAAFGGMLILLPVLVIKNTRLYGLALFHLFVLIERDIGKNLTKEVIDGSQFVNTWGIPPMGNVAIIIRPSDIVLFFLILSWIPRILTKKEKFQFSGFGYLGLAYLAWAALSFELKAAYPLLSLLDFVHAVKYFLLFVYVANAINTKELIKGLIGVLMICLFVEGAIAFAGLKYEWARDPLSFLSDSSKESISALPFVFEETESGYRTVGTFGNFAMTALYLHFLLPLALTQWAINLRNRKQWLYLFLFTLGLATMWVTYSRTGLLAAFFGLSFCAFLCHYRRLFTTKVFHTLIYVGILSMLVLSPKIYKFLSSRPSTLPERYPLIEKAVTMIADSPVLGIGLNNSTAVKKDLFPELLPDEHKQPIHNYYLVIAVETGLVGFMLSMGFFGLIGKEAFRQMMSPDIEIAAVAVAIIATYASIAVHMLGDAMFSHVPLLMLMFYGGLIVAFRRMEQTAKEGRSREPYRMASAPAARAATLATNW